MKAFARTWLVGFALVAMLAWSAQAQPMVQAGVADLRAWNWEENPQLKLNGEWQFYWGDFLDPENPQPIGEGQLVKVPSDWNLYSVAGITDKGFATYRLRLILPEEAPPMAVRLFDVQSSYRLYANGQLIGFSGLPHREEAKAKPHTGIAVHSLSVVEGEVDLILHVSGYHHFQSGLRYPMVIGPEQEMYAAWNAQQVLEVLLIGGMSLIAFLFFGVYFFRKKDLANLYFALLCLSVDLRLVASSSRALEGHLLHFDWALYFDLAYISYFSGVGFFALYLSKLYPQHTPKLLLQVTLPFAFGSALLVVATPPYLYSHWIPIFGVLTFFIMFFYLLVFVRAWRDQKVGASFGFIGSLLLFLAIANDILYGMGVIQTGFYNHYFFVAYLFSQALVQGLRMDRAFFQIRGLEREVKAKDKALERIRSEILDNSSKNVTSPLRAIAEISESLLMDEKLTKSVQEGVRRIHLSSLRLTTMVSDILGYLQPQPQPTQLRILPLDLHTQIAEVIYQINLFDPNNPMLLENRVDLNLPKILIDKFRLQQILFHFLESSLKISPQGKLIFSSSLLDGRVLLEMTLEQALGHQNKTHELLKKALSSGELVAEMGLSVAQALLEAMEGKLGIAYSEEAGISYWMELPIATLDKENEIYAQTLSAIQADEVALQNTELDQEFRVLVVDDEKLSFLMIQKILEPYRFKLEHASNGLVALDTLAEAEPDLLVVDLMMPWMSGFEFITKIRQDLSMERMPILVITSMNNSKDYITSMELGANDFIRKPIEKVELINKVKGLLQIRKAYLLSQSLMSRPKAEAEDLSLAKIRLSQLIEHSMNGLLLLDPEYRISYINQLAASFFGETASNLRGVMFQSLFEQPITIVPNEEMTLIAKNQKELNFNFIPIEEEKEASLVAIVSESLVIRKSDLVGAIHQAPLDFHTVVRNFVQASHREGGSVVLSMQELERSMDEVTEDIKRQESRVALVELMNAIVTAWEEMTGTSKIDLAEQSGIWTAYLDRGVFRTRTLDKYLSLETLPNKPRWKDVTQTAEFVLRHKSAKNYDLSAVRLGLEKLAALIQL